MGDNPASKNRACGSSAGAAFFCALESLEQRQLLSTVIHPQLIRIPARRTIAAYTSSDGYSPKQMKQAYGFNKIKFGTVSGDGTGQTIAIVDAYSDPHIVSDLAHFDKQFGLPDPPVLKQVNQTGKSKLPAADRSWASEIAMDVEWAHAMAPGANILLVCTASDDISDLVKGTNYARTVPGVSVVSLSWGGGEFGGQLSYDKYLQTPGNHTAVTFVAASGDEGATGGAEWPASSPGVLAVGGTTLNLSRAGNITSESAWSSSSGGASRFESKPAYQNPFSGFERLTADVSYDADPNTGIAVYDTYGDNGWYGSGGTSAGTPQWAALIAVIDQGRKLKKLGTLDGQNTLLPALYTLSRDPTSYATNFHDITTGTNVGDDGGGDGGPWGGGFVHHPQPGASTAGIGYDNISGLGSPRAAALAYSLVYGPQATPARAIAAIAKAKVKVKPKVVKGQPGGTSSGNVAPPPIDGFDVAATPLAPITLANNFGVAQPGPQTNVLTAEGLARPITNVAAPAGSAASRPVSTLVALSGALTATTERLVAKVAVDVATDVAPAVAAASHLKDQAGVVAADATKAVAPAVYVSAQMFDCVALDAASTFNDALASFTDESAAIQTIPVDHSTRRPWLVTAAVVLADVVLVGHYFSSRTKRRALRAQAEQDVFSNERLAESVV